MAITRLDYIYLLIYQTHQFYKPAAHANIHSNRLHKSLQTNARPDYLPKSPIVTRPKKNDARELGLLFSNHHAVYANSFPSVFGSSYNRRQKAAEVVKSNVQKTR